MRGWSPALDLPGHSPDAFHVVVYALTTDKGGDKANACRRIGTKIMDEPHKWMIAQFCIMHTIQLMILKQLTRLGSYFSSMAKLSNVWRAPHNAARIFIAWKDR